MPEIPAHEKKSDKPQETKPEETKPLVNEIAGQDRAELESELARLIARLKSDNGKLRGELARVVSTVEELTSKNAGLEKLANAIPGSNAPTKSEIYLSLVTGAMATINPLADLNDDKVKRLSSTLPGLAAVLHLGVSTHKNFLPTEK